MSQTPVTLHFGKGALTAAWIGELRDQVKRRRLVKVRLLGAARAQRTARSWAEDMAVQAGVRLLDVRGHTATFACL